VPALLTVTVVRGKIILETSSSSGQNPLLSDRDFDEIAKNHIAEKEKKKARKYATPVIA